ncbi:MAG: hypothetical protein ABI883_04225 [Chthoniobacterales bacterium]
MESFSSLYVIDDSEPRSAATNMALDEALLAHAPAPTLRFYRWRNPALSFGYFGRFADAGAEAAGREIVRRWTGGGIVLHGTDVTYSVVVPQQQLSAAHSARAVYSLVHAAIGRALAEHMQVEVAARDAVKVSDACFANPVTADVLVNGQKIAGAAQRRTRDGLLLQGSVQCATLPASFRTDFAAALHPACERGLLAPEVIDTATAIAARRYATDEWQRLR